MTNPKILPATPFSTRFRSRGFQIALGIFLIEWFATVAPAAQTLAAETVEVNAQTLFQRQGPALFLAMAGFLLIFRRRSRIVRHSAAGESVRAPVLQTNPPRHDPGKQPPSSP